MPGSDGLGFLVILNKSSELRFGLRRSELGFESVRGQSTCLMWGAHAFFGSDETVSIEKVCVSVSPRVENLNLKKVIKVSWLYQWESSVFRVFWDFYSMNICIFYIYVWWLMLHFLLVILCDQFLFQGHYNLFRSIERHLIAIYNSLREIRFLMPVRLGTYWGWTFSFWWYFRFGSSWLPSEENFPFLFFRQSERLLCLK